MGDVDSGGATATIRHVVVKAVLNRFAIQYEARLLPYPASFKQRLLEYLQTVGMGRGLTPLSAGNLPAIAQKISPSR